MAWLKWVLIILGILAGLWIAWGFISWHVWEKPKYEVLKKFDEVEVRKYGQLTVISTTAANGEKAFSKLGGYIFEGNEQQQKISMTAPVYTQPQGEEMEMRFYLPEGYDTTNAPRPLSEEVKISMQESRIIAVIPFGGLYDKQKFEENRQQLLNKLQEQKIEPVGEAFVFRYDDPWVPPFMRRNEVGIEVRLD